MIGTRPNWTLPLLLCVGVLVAESALSPTRGQQIVIPEKPIYSRSDCMVRIDYKKNAGSEKEAYPLWKFTQFLFRYAPKKGMLFGFTSGLPGDGLFLMYNLRCNEKIEFTEEMIGAFVKQNPGYFEKVSVSRDRISPNFEVSISCGDWWTDGWAGCQ